MTDKIESPGLYALSMNDYHSDCCVGPSISSSGLRTIIEDGPAAYWRTSYLNPQRIEEPEKPAFTIGKAAHTYLLEPERLLDSIAVYPAEALAKNGAASTKAAKDFAEAQIAAGKEAVLKPDEWDMIVAMRDALAEHPHARRALVRGRTEASMLWPYNSAWVKARPDFMPESDGQYIVDFKTAESLAFWQTRAMVDHRLDMQAALQIWGAHEVLGIEPLGVMFIVQSKQPGHDVAMMTLSIRDEDTRSLLDAARLDLRRGLETFESCLAANRWPTGWEDPREIRLPFWRQKQIENQLKETEYEFPNDYAL